MKKLFFRCLDKLLLPKSTIELGDLNILWERFNDGENVEGEILSRRWPYQVSKVKLLLELHHIKFGL